MAWIMELRPRMNEGKAMGCGYLAFGTNQSRAPVSVGGAVGRPERAVRPGEAGVALAPGPAILAGDAVQEHLPVAGAVGGGRPFGLPGCLQRPAQPAAVVAAHAKPVRPEEVVNDEDGVEEQRRVEESKEAETRMSPWLLLAGRRLHWMCFDLALLQKPSYELCSCGAS
jgi:hypothetical protein